MKLFVAAVVVACLAVAAWVASISLQAVDRASPLVVGLTLWAAVPALAVGLALVGSLAKGRAARQAALGLRTGSGGGRRRFPASRQIDWLSEL